MILRKTLLILFGFTLFLSCENNPLDVDTSNIKVEINFVNIDSLLFYTDSAELIQAHHFLKKEVKNIYDYEIGHVLKVGDVVDSAFYNSMLQFRADSSIQDLEKSISLLIPTLKQKESELIGGFKHLKYHFPNGVIPKNITYLNALFTTAIFCTEEEIGVGAEWYLGKENKIVQQLNTQYFFKWMKNVMDVRYYERDVLTGWIETHYVEPVDGNLAENFIRWGKVLYLTESAFPDKDKSIILRYSIDNFQWAMDNEEQFWEYLVKEKLLFKTDEKTTRNMINEGPFTPGLPNQEAPDRLGQFIGWRMVHQYMKKNEVSLEELINVTYNDILQAYEID